MNASRDAHGAIPANRGSHWCLLARRRQGRLTGAGAAIGAAAASGRRKAQIAAVTAVMIVAAASFSARPAAAQQSASPADGLRYRLIDLGTLGGPNSAETQEFPYINNTGMVAGFADTATPNPGNPEGFVFHAFRWRGGPLTDLGTLPGGVNSFAIWSNNAGTVAGLSENGRIDPLLGMPEGRGVLWKKSGQIVNLGTFGGHESLAGYINDRGQIVGVAANRKRDPFSLFGWGTQTRAFLWQKGIMRDLGTLGGPDANAAIVNNHGQVAGASYTNSAPNPDTGSPTLHPFLWTHGTMADLGEPAQKDVGADAFFFPVVDGAQVDDLLHVRASRGNPRSLTQPDPTTGPAATRPASTTGKPENYESRARTGLGVRRVGSACRRRQQPPGGRSRFNR